MIARIIDQLTWLGAACRASTAPDQPSLFVPTTRSDADGTVSIGYRETSWDSTARINRSEHEDCWLSMFRNPAIASGFPIRPRGANERGLEIPFIMMMGLGQTERLTEFDNQPMLTGFSTLMVPVWETAGSVGWHFLRKKDGEEVLFSDAFDVANFPTRVAPNLNTLEFQRHFVVGRGSPSGGAHRRRLRSLMAKFGLRK